MSNIENQAQSDADIAAKSGFGEPVTEEEIASLEGETTTDGEESSVTETEENDDEEEVDDQDEPEEGEDDQEKTTTPKRTVPYSKFKTEREKRKAVETELYERRELRDAIQGLTQIIASQQSDSKDASKSDPDEIETAAAELAEELGLDNTALDSKALAKILEKATTLAGKKLPTELKEKLKILDSLEEKSELQAEQVHFDNEWSDFIPTLKETYPNATEAMLQEAKDEMDKLAHSKDFHAVKELEYILFKNKKKFETILKVAKGNRSAELGKRIGAEADEPSIDDAMVDIENMTPDLMRRREQADLRANTATKNKDYTIINPIN